MSFIFTKIAVVAMLLIGLLIFVDGILDRFGKSASWIHNNFIDLVIIGLVLIGSVSALMAIVSFVFGWAY